jgi:multidrug efflux pump
MVLSDVSIKRPVLATVLSLVLLIFGLFAFRGLTVREYPDIDPPIVTVNTIYRGASPEIIENQITQIIEEAVAGIEGIKSIASSSREESSSVSIEFTLDRDVDSAANDVRDRVSRIIAKLPDEADPPTVAKTETDARPVLWMTLTSDRMDALDLTDYAERYLVDRFSTVPGVASVTVGGGRRYSMRIRLDPAALSARSLTVQDVEAAIRRQNVDLPSGRIEGAMREFAVRTESGLRTPDEFRNLVIREREGFLTRLGEVAKVELAAENERTEMLSNGRQTVGIGIVRQSKGNTLEVARGVKEEAARLRESLPAGMALDPAYDQSIFIDRSIYEVEHALMVAMALVVGVIFVFLRSWRATLIPAVAIPVSIIGSFIVIAALGYSINVLTLLALVLAIGLVVDDAIVVLENIHRRIEEGEPPLLAAARGARQIGFAVISTTLVLIAVFVPISFLEGNTGRLFREFGISVAAAVLFSGFVALSLTPMMCSKLLRETSQESVLVRATEWFFVGMQRGYRWLLAATLRMPVVVIALAVFFSGIAYGFYRAIPREFAPVEDRGIVFLSVTAPEGSSLDYTKRNVLEIERRMMTFVERGDANSVMTILAPSFARPGPVNTAFSIVRLKLWDERPNSQQRIVAEAFPMLGGVPGVRAFAINPPSLGQRGFQPPVQFVLGGPTYEVLDAWAERLLARAAENPRLINLSKDYEESRPELRVRIDRDRAADLGVSVETIGRTLETLLGSRFVTTFEREGKKYNVMVQARPEDRARPQDLKNIYVRTAAGDRLVPLSNLVTLEESASARELNRVDRLRAVTMSASLAPGYTLGEALDYMERIAAEELPPEARISYGGQSREYKESSAALYVTFGLALLVVFLVLAAQFESFIHPAIIMVSVPLAVTGALGSMLLYGVTMNVYSQIGIIMLVGLIAKNAILIVEFANQLRDAGKGIFDAVLDAAAIRLRPILMTTISTIFGALPLAIGSGAGAESRRALGIVVIGGMAFATVLSLFVVPVLYLLLARFSRPAGFIARRLSELESGHERAAEQPAE